MARKERLYGCMKCVTYKPRSAFSMGPSGKRIAHVCDECKAEEARQRKARQPAVTTKVIDGVLSRRCSLCKTWKPLVEGFHRSRKDRKNLKQYDYWCKTCQAARMKERYYKRRADPELRRRDQKLANARTKRWRKANPERALETGRQYKERVRKDPERHAAMLESQRIAYRLRKERKGEKYNEDKQHRGSLGAFSLLAHERFLDPEPLREWLEAVVAREVPDEGNGGHRSGKENRDGRTMEELAAMLETNTRFVRRIRLLEQKHVSLPLADNLLTRYGQVVEVNGYGPVMRVEDLWPELSEDA